jgi:hypothetical protein
MENSVAALTIVRDNQLLLVQRCPRANRTHPNIVSVPTMRIPWPLAQGLVGLYGAPVVSSEFSNGHDPRIFAAEAVMSRKLGTALEDGRPKYDVGVAAIVSGTAEYETGETESGATSEPLRMINLCVTLRESAMFAFPATTASYSKVFWVQAADFLRSPMKFWWGPMLRGLCVSSTKRVLCSPGAL